MADTFTSNYNFIIASTGSDSGVWGSNLNSYIFNPLDTILGATVAVTLTSSNVTLTLTQWVSGGAFKLTGALTTNVSLILPLSPNASGGTPAVGGKFVVDNECTGNFTVTVLTAASGSTGVVVPQGSRSSLYSDTVNVWFADESRSAKIAGYAGNPNGNVAGVAANAATGTPASLVLNTNTNQVYSCTTTGNAASAVWSLLSTFVPSPQGYLTPVSGTPIITGDQVGVSTIYYTPYVGNICPVYNGSTFVPVTFSELTLALSSGYQAANGIYDVFFFLNSGTPTVAFGPAWSAGSGGNQTAGSCARGTGAGGTALSRVNGLLTNAVSVSANNGSSTYTISANQGTYVGSLYVDGANGQVTMHRTWGQNRKWGIYNQYNKSTVILLVGDSTASWLYVSNTIRASNNTPASWSSAAFNAGSGTTCNGMTVLTGMAEEEIDCSFTQKLLAVSTGSGQEVAAGIGINSITARTGTWADVYAQDGSYLAAVSTGRYVSPPQLGITTVCAVESCLQNTSSSDSFFGTQAFMTLAAVFRA